MLLMSTHNICFHGETRKNIYLGGLSFIYSYAHLNNLIIHLYLTIHGGGTAFSDALYENTTQVIWNKNWLEINI